MIGKETKIGDREEAKIVKQSNLEIGNAANQ